MEYQDDVVRRTAADTGCEVLNGLAALRGSARLPADAIHPGDVIEHLPAPLDVLQDLAGLLRPGGWLMAQGPLEAGPCLFTAVLRAASALRPGRVTRMPPYHVLQASVEGQRVLFDRVGLAELTYTVSEVAWPAPGRLSGAKLSQPRSVALYALRKLSQAVSAVNPRRWGNRYFYVGMAAVRNVSFAGRKDFFQDRMLAYVEKTWDQWLGPLVPGLPTFQAVIGNLRPQIAELVPAGQQPRPFPR